MTDIQNSIQIYDPECRHAIELIDSGSVKELIEYLKQKPHLLSQKIETSYGDGYFQSPHLLWFTAENPIRNASLPDNIVDVIEAIIVLGKYYNVEGFDEHINYTLGLVSSGCIAREDGHQSAMIKSFVDHGADPNQSIRTCLAHREIQAAKTLLDCGARLTLLLASGLGYDKDVAHLIDHASKIEKQDALAAAAINCHPKCIDILLKNGANPNLFHPEGLHKHTTPLHQAIFYGCLDSVRLLVAAGADIHIKDTLFDGNAIGWANHAQHEHVIKFLSEQN